MYEREYEMYAVPGSKTHELPEALQWELGDKLDMLTKAIAVEFGFAEEVIFYLRFELPYMAAHSHYHIVLVGEVLRPTEVYYYGTDRSEALTAFSIAIDHHKYL